MSLTPEEKQEIEREYPNSCLLCRHKPENSGLFFPCAQKDIIVLDPFSPCNNHEPKSDQETDHD